MNNADQFRSDIIFENQVHDSLFTGKGHYCRLFWVPSHCGLFGNKRADRIANHGALGYILSHVDITLSTRETFNIIENRMQTHLNLSNYFILNAPGTFVSLMYSSVQDGIYALGKVHTRSTPSLKSFPNVGLETVPNVGLIDDGLFSRPLKEDR